MIQPYVLLSVLCKIRNTSKTYHSHEFMLICFSTLVCIAYYILSLKSEKKSNHCAKKERLRFTTPLPNTCQGKENEWHKASTGANKGQYGGHEGVDDKNDAWCTLAYKKKIDSNSKFVTLFANTSGKGLAVMCEIVIFYMLSEQKREMRSTHWNQSSSNPHPFWRRKWYEQAANTIYSDGEEMENQTQWTRI